MRILLVEDDLQLLSSVGRGLREASYDVDEVANGSQALAMATSAPYDALVVDILLPGMDGIALCSELRSRENWVPILLLTALDAVEDRIRGLDAGADDYLPKPFDFGELLARLRALTRRRSERMSPHLQVGDLTIDTRRREVRRGTREIDLTATEYEFLVYMARNAGRAITRDEFASEVWDDKLPHSNVIDVYASRIRRKVDLEEEPPLFSTLRGVGYMLDASGVNRGTEPPPAEY